MTMRFGLTGLLIVATYLALGPAPSSLNHGAHSSASQTFALDSPRDLTLSGVKAEFVTYRGRKALRLVEDRTADSRGQTVALIKPTDFSDGTIEVDVAGKPAAGASDTARGFVGIAFRSAPDLSRFEYFYIRPTNGRADDQLRRNHSNQYASHPDYPWERLRKENPGVYESYADMAPGEWTRLRIVIKGLRAEFYLNAMEQPCLIVKDLKLGAGRGQVGLWIGPETDAYFANLKITPTQN
jgi:hypothetical protein